MTWSLSPRPATDADEDSIIELEQLVWGSAEEATHEYFQWCLKNPAGQSITYIIRNDSGSILSMHMVIPLPAFIIRKPALAGISVNVVTHPDYRRNGFSNHIAAAIYPRVKELGIEFLLALPNAMSYSFFTGKNNFIDLGKPLILIRWIDPGILIGQHGFPNLAKSMGFLTKVISWTFTKKRNSFTKVIHVEDLDKLNMEKLLEPNDFHLAIDSNWLRWRYVQHPFVKYEFAIVGDLETPQAFVVYELMEPYKRALIMEFLAVRDVSLESVQTLMEGVVKKCKAAGCSSVCCLGVPHSRKTDLLRKSGFWVFPFDSVWRPRILVNSNKSISSEFSLSSMDISYGALINIG